MTVATDPTMEAALGAVVQVHMPQWGPGWGALVTHCVGGCEVNFCCCLACLDEVMTAAADLRRASPAEHTKQ